MQLLVQQVAEHERAAVALLAALQAMRRQLASMVQPPKAAQSQAEKSGRQGRKEVVKKVSVAVQTGVSAADVVKGTKPMRLKVPKINAVTSVPMEEKMTPAAEQKAVRRVLDGAARKLMRRMSANDVLTSVKEDRNKTPAASPVAKEGGDASGVVPIKTGKTQAQKDRRVRQRTARKERKLAATTVVGKIKPRMVGTIGRAHGLMPAPYPVGVEEQGAPLADRQQIRLLSSWDKGPMTLIPRVKDFRLRGAENSIINQKWLRVWGKIPTAVSVKLMGKVVNVPLKPEKSLGYPYQLPLLLAAKEWPQQEWEEIVEAVLLWAANGAPKVPRIAWANVSNPAQDEGIEVKSPKKRPNKNRKRQASRLENAMFNLELAEMGGGR